MKIIIVAVLIICSFIAGYVYARKHPDYSSYWAYDKITRSEWQELGWGTDPTEKPHQSGDFWCKKHIDGNGEGCSPYFRPEFRKE